MDPSGLQDEKPVDTFDVGPLKLQFFVPGGLGGCNCPATPGSPGEKENNGKDKLLQRFTDPDGTTFEIRCFKGQYFYGVWTQKGGKPIPSGKCLYPLGWNKWLPGVGKDGKSLVFRWINLQPAGKTEKEMQDNRADIEKAVNGVMAANLDEGLAKIKDVLANLKDKIADEAGNTKKAVIYLWPEKKVLRLTKDGKWVDEPATGVPFEFEQPK